MPPRRIARALIQSQNTLYLPELLDHARQLRVARSGTNWFSISSVASRQRRPRAPRESSDDYNAKASHSTDQIDPRKVSRVHDASPGRCPRDPKKPEAEKLGRTILQLLGLTALRAADGLDEIPALVRL